MKKQFVYFYFMKKKSEIIKFVVPSHVEYWGKHNLQKYMGGPFADRTGGIITFEAENIVLSDPFVTEDLLEDKWKKEWIVE